MPKQHWMVSSLRIITIMFVLIGCLIVFWYTPYYSNLVVKVLNAFVPVEVDQVAAQSQQMASLNEESDGLEPGSEVWIARQAYLRVMEEAIHSQNTQDLTSIQARYKALLKKLEEEKAEDDQQDDQAQIPLLLKNDGQEGASSVTESASEVAIDEDPFGLSRYDTEENKALMDKFVTFLNEHPVDMAAEKEVDSDIYKDIAYIQSQNDKKKKLKSEPYAIVILGGGLTMSENKKDIVVNDYTRLRLEKTLQIEKETKLPIVLSGVEAPYMQAWLKERGIEAKLLENKSMNTCENTRFSSLLLQKKGGAPTVLLITDRYHMPRTRRLFALNGIETIPVEAPMPTQLTDWQPSKQNYDHSRRANYEMLATIRDVLFGSSGCREVP